MAGNLHVRNLDDELIARLKRRAARHGRSTEAEHREILRQAPAAEVEPRLEKLAADLRKRTRHRHTSRVDQHARIEHPLRVERAFGGLERRGEERRALAVVPWAVLAPDR